MVWMGQEGITSPAGVLSFKINDGADTVGKGQLQFLTIKSPASEPAVERPQRGPRSVRACFSVSLRL